jgi:hypothetical protein
MQNTWKIGINERLMVNGTTIIIGVYGDKFLAEKDLKGLIE